MMEKAESSERLVKFYQTERRHIIDTLILRWGSLASESWGFKWMQHEALELECNSVLTAVSVCHWEAYKGFELCSEQWMQTTIHTVNGLQLVCIAWWNIDGQQICAYG